MLCGCGCIITFVSTLFVRLVLMTLTHSWFVNARALNAQRSYMHIHISSARGVCVVALRVSLRGGEIRESHNSATGWGKWGKKVEERPGNALRNL